jgi:Uma2 family endonuclease
MSITPQKYRFDVATYYDIATIFNNQRVELIEGEVIVMSAIGNRHAACVSRLTHLLVTRIGTTSAVRIQDPVRLNRFSELEPDLCISRFRKDFYENAHPIPEDILLLIEVANSSLQYDKEIKIPLYAGHNIPEVWLVNLIENRVTVYSKPQSSKYINSQYFQIDTQIVSQQIPQLSLAVSEIFNCD